MIYLTTEQAQQIEDVTQRVLEILESYFKHYGCYGTEITNTQKALSIIREARAQEQAEQEPVAWMQKASIEWVKHPHNERNQTQVIVTGVKVFDGQVPLYAAPVRTKDLTYDEIADVFRVIRVKESWSLDFARAVIAADREKNKREQN